MLFDRFDRAVSYIRISVTDRCNLKCRYCVGGRLPFVSHKEILRYEEIIRLARICAGLGVNKIRITGGEPLIKKGIPVLIKEIGAIPGITDVGLTTNGVHLAGQLPDLQVAGLKRINISLDTLKRRRFAAMTGVDAFDQVWNSINLAIGSGLNPVKINTVIIDGFNDDEVLDFVKLAKTRNVEVRFIEFMPFGDSGLWESSRVITSWAIEEFIRTRYILERSSCSSGGPAMTYAIKGGAGRIGFISPLSSHLCRQCNRIRVTAQGGIRPCLFSGQEYDVKALLRGGASDEEIKRFVKEVVRAKPQRRADMGQVRKCRMNLRQIGG
ncbi:MAG: Cyclic pyranopterin monophosphate synthase [Syntrophorhabdaceae bacterium PtaU1.Bin034]|jgi:cyclic pyranopterin phosphate synthase|nr:MAG: Cyclic pyranopterin monophosphate synthase [Syntrophorhabdaceae bacterium PtaU1.Bin034]